MPKKPIPPLSGSSGPPFELSDMEKEAHRVNEMFRNVSNRGGRYIVENGKPTQSTHLLLGVLDKLCHDGYIHSLEFEITPKYMEVTFRCGLNHLDTISPELESVRQHLNENSKASDSHGNAYNVTLPLITNPSSLLD